MHRWVVSGLVVTLMSMTGAASAATRLDRALVATADRVARLSPWPLDRLDEMVRVALLAHDLGDDARAQALVDDALADLWMVPVKRDAEGGDAVHHEGVDRILRLAALADGCRRTEQWVEQRVGNPNVLPTHL